MKGYIHSIETFGTVDGPGVRFVVFFQGCSLHCLYCHNPDTWCHNGGTQYEASELISKMLRNLPFYKTGGITASGGEPMLQLDFLCELFSLAKKEGISTCLDTSGIIFDKKNTALTEKIDELLSLCDLVMLDIKHIDENEHIKLTGHSNKNVLDFAKYLDKKHIKMRVRHVIVPDITFKEEYLLRLGEFIGKKFEITLSALDDLSGLGIAEWTKPRGGYFVSLNVLPGTAKRVWELMKSAGVTLTNVGATFPYGIDPKDENLRIAPTYPSNDELKTACAILTVATRLAALEKLMEK
jgi:pyruvate formate lyase activating enzyme